MADSKVTKDLKNAKLALRRAVERRLDPHTIVKLEDEVARAQAAKDAARAKASSWAL